MALTYRYDVRPRTPNVVQWHSGRTSQWQKAQGGQHATVWSGTVTTWRRR